MARNVMTIEPSKLLGCDFASRDPQDVGPNEFTFESDHEALKTNPDYLALMKTFAILQAQKIQAVNDIDTLLVARDEALKDPLALVEKLQRGEGLQVPGKQTIAEIPDIEWEKYNIVCNDVSRRPETRNRTLAISDDISNGSKVSKLPVEGLGCKVERTSRGQFLVRGRVFDDQKPKTFNQPWTPEEQSRLEELLVQFPSEDVEMERWKKIANALGNRTAIQVQSRTQKYFLKLQKLGLPVPGRHVKMRQKSSYTKGAKNISSAKGSSFFPHLTPAVKMNDEDDETLSVPKLFQNPDSLTSFSSSLGILNDLYTYEEEDVSDEEEVPESLRGSAKYEELMWLKRIRREKELEEQMGSPMIHQGFRCDGCNVEPIVGGRFQCIECKGADTVDFCCDCAPKGIEIGKHLKLHKMRPVRRRKNKSLLDKEYVDTSKRNYLDPNFLQ